jgi:hypothetical protein
MIYRLQLPACNSFLALGLDFSQTSLASALDTCAKTAATRAASPTHLAVTDAIDLLLVFAG